MKTIRSVEPPQRVHVDVHGLLRAAHRRAAASALLQPEQMDFGMFRDELHLACLRAIATRPAVSQREMCNRILRLRTKCVGELAPFAVALEAVIEALGGVNACKPATIIHYVAHQRLTGRRER